MIIVVPILRRKQLNSLNNFRFYSPMKYNAMQNTLRTDANA